MAMKNIFSKELFMAEIYASKLHSELVAANIEINGCDSTGIVWDKNNKEIQDRDDVQAVIILHDPTPIPDETIEEMVDRKISEALTPTP
jgi:hypothetical protein